MDKLNYLVSKAELIDKAEIPNPIILNLDSFYEKKGKLYFVKSENSFYKFDNFKWFKLGENKQSLPNKEVSLEDVKKEVLGVPDKVLDTKYNEVLAWANQFKAYVDNKFKELEARQDQMLDIIKENIDLKFKNLNKKK